MCLNLEGENDNGQKFFFKKFLEGGENDKGGKMTEGITVIEKYESEWKTKLGRETERINKQHKQEINQLNEKLSKQSVIIESKNDEIWAYILRISKLKEEYKNLETELNALKEVAKYYSDNFFDVYHLKTWLLKDIIMRLNCFYCKITYVNFSL